MERLRRHENVKYSILLAIQIIFWLLFILFSDRHEFQGLVILATVVVFCIVVVMLKPKKILRMLTISSGIIGVLGSFIFMINHITGLEFTVAITVGRFTYAFFILMALLSISYNVFITDKVTSDQIIGGVCVYILIATFFACVYAGFCNLLPGSLVFTSGPEKIPNHLAQYMYYSIMMLTTTGLGDMIPLHPAVRFVSSIEGVIGPIYLAIMMARLVGMHLSQHKGSKES